MGRPFSWDVDPANANLVGFASNVTGATWTLTANDSGDSLAHQVSIRNDSVTDHSAKTALLTGTGANGQALTETVNLPSTSATIESTQYFLTLTSVVPSSTIGADTMDIGWVDEVVTATYPLNHRGDVPAAYVVSGSSGTYSAAIEETFVDFQNKLSPAAVTYAPVWLSNQGTPAGTTAIDISQAGLPNATGARLRLISYTDTAELQFTISQRSASE